MFQENTFHRRLSIVVSPEGDYYTPTYEGYSFAEAEPKVIVAALTGKGQYFWQKVVPFTRRRLWGLWVKRVWQATTETKTFDRIPRGWKILCARPFRTPKELTPVQAEQCSDYVSF